MEGICWWRRVQNTHPVQGQVREEQLLVTVPPEIWPGVPKGQVLAAGSGLDLDLYAATVICPSVSDTIPLLLLWLPLDPCDKMGISKAVDGWSKIFSASP